MTLAMDGARTRPGLVAFLILGGVVAAAQLGKIFVAAPLIQTELKLGLTALSVLLSVFGALGGLFGFGAGVLARRIGMRRAFIGGMALMACASALGATSQSTLWLVATRVIEGIGFLSVALTTPDLLQRATSARDRPLIFGVWSAYVGVGATVTLLCAPLIAAIGWRALWLTCAALAAVHALAATSLLFQEEDTAPAPSRRLAQEARAALGDPGCRLLALAFFCYTFHYFVIAGFLPVLLVERMGVSVAAAGLLTAVAVAANALGNVVSGALMRAGSPIWLNIAAPFALLLGGGALIFAFDLSPVAVTAIATAALGCGGVAPGSIFGIAPSFAAPGRPFTPIVGMIQQASNLGQLVGPMSVGFFASRFGWSVAPLALAPVALLGLFAAYRLGRLTRSRLAR